MVQNIYLVQKNQFLLIKILKKKFLKKFLGIFWRKYIKKNNQFGKQVIQDILAQFGILEAEELEQLERKRKNLIGEVVAVIKRVLEYYIFWIKNNSNNINSYI